MKRRIRAAHNALPAETLGIMGMVGAMFFFSLMDVLAKELGTLLPTAQVVWARYTSQSVIVVAICMPRLRTLLASDSLGLQLLRSVFLFGATFQFFISLKLLALVEAVALLNTAPLMITILAALILREHVGPRRWAAVILGLIGALIIIRPGLGVFQPASLIAIGAAFFLAAYQVATRMIGGADGIWTTMLYTTSFGALISTAVLPWVWQPPGTEAWLMMAVIGAVGMLGQLCIIWALAQAPASTLAPLNYTSLVWASINGLVIFAEIPDMATLVGAAVIVGAGLYVWHRERVRGRVMMQLPD